MATSASASRSGVALPAPPPLSLGHRDRPAGREDADVAHALRCAVDHGHRGDVAGSVDLALAHDAHLPRLRRRHQVELRRGLHRVRVLGRLASSLRSRSRRRRAGAGDRAALRPSAVPPAEPVRRGRGPHPLRPSGTGRAEEAQRRARWLVWLVVIAAFFGADAARRLRRADRPEGRRGRAGDRRQRASRGRGHRRLPRRRRGHAGRRAPSPAPRPTRRGRTIEIVVTNHEDKYEWQSGPLGTLS